MTLERLTEKLESTGFPVAFRVFPKDEPHEPPFICYLVTGSNPFAADGTVYSMSQAVQVELYTMNKEPAAEAALEAVLADQVYQKDEGYLQADEMYMVTYQFEI